MNSHSNESQKLKRRLKILASLLISLILVIVLSANYFKLSLFKSSLPGSVVEVETPSKAEITSSSLEIKTKELKNKRAEYKRTRTKDVANEIQRLAKERKKILIETTRFNPDAALSQILSAEERADTDLKAIAENDIEQENIVEGELEVSHGDNFGGKNSQTDYSILTSKNEKLSLRPTRSLRTNLFSAKKIKVRGFKVDNELLFNGMGDISAPEKVEGASGFQVLQEAAALNTVKVVILMANFQNTVQPNVTPQEVKNTLNQVDGYYQENSYGRVGISGDVFGWYNIPMNQVCVPNDSALSYAINAAQQQGVNFSQYSVVAVYAPFGGPNCQWGGYAKWNGIRKIWISYINLYILAHEIGHQLGVGHAKFYDCGAVPVAESSCKTDEYGDPHDVMGSGEGHYNAIHKIQKGWLNSSNVNYVSQNGLYTIEPIETNTNGFKIIKVGDYFIEYRQPIGFDKVLGNWSNAFDGALFTIGSTLLLDANASPTDLAKNTQAALKLGETFFVPSTNITITPVSKTPEALTLDIRFDGTVPPPPPLIVADFVAKPQTGQAPLAIQFTDKSTGNNINAWQWDFNNDGIIDSDKQNPLYIYGNSGSYAVSLTVSGFAGSKTETRLNYINVESPPSSGSISASSNPCAIISPATTCSSAITWNTQNATNPCIFIKESGKTFVCGISGNNNAPWIDVNGATFELHEKNDINSKLLASIFVKGEIQTISSLSLNISQSGTGRGTITAQGINCGLDCSETYNQGTSVTLTAAPDANSIFKNWSGDCSGTNNTCNLTMNANKSATASFDVKTTSPSVCSTGSIRACIDSISPNPVNQGQTVTFAGSAQTDDTSKTISKYRWRLDSITGRTRICKTGENVICQADTAAIPVGVHTIYFRVGTSKFLGLRTEWSSWIGTQFTVGNDTIPPVCGNNICEPGENSGNCLQDCPIQPRPQCSDGIDNDNDNKIDYPVDPGCASATDNDETNPAAIIPDAPTDLTITLGNKPSPNTRELFLRWKDISLNEDKFEIQTRFKIKDFSSPPSTHTTPANGSYYTFRAAEERGRTYYFRIRACNIAGCSDYTGEKSYAF